MITGFAVLLVLFPFLFWYQTWFGRRLSDAQIEGYLHDGKARHAQHALVQIGERMALRDARVSRWYPRVAELAASPVVELRQTAAWIMGQEHGYPPFRDALTALLRDPEPMVRRNAALSLAGLRDQAARPELLVMMRPYTLHAPVGGTVAYRLKLDEYVNPGTLVGRVGGVELRAPLPGRVQDLPARPGAPVAAGDPVAEIAPADEHVFEALRALYLVGQPPDLAEVERFARDAGRMPDKIRRQAGLTAGAIRARGQQPGL